MKRYIQSSAGDVTLCKFILVPMDMINSTDECYYDQFLKGYFYMWNYTYNTITRHTDDREYAHSDIIDNLPYEIRKHARKLTIWGKTDYYTNSVRFSIVNSEYLTPNQVDRIKQYCT